jgi:hypothetical protein
VFVLVVVIVLLVSADLKCVGFIVGVVGLEISNCRMRQASGVLVGIIQESTVAVAVVVVEPC